MAPHSTLLSGGFQSIATVASYVYKFCVIVYIVVIIIEQKKSLPCWDKTYYGMFFTTSSWHSVLLCVYN